MESGSEDEDNVVQMRAALQRKTQELKQMQDEFDEYTQSSHELEQELEQELSRVEKRNAHLLNKNQHFERDLQLVRSKLEEVLEQAHQFEDELSITRAELETAQAARRKLEQDQDDLETQVRVLQATEADLRHKMEREMEEKVFLISDQEELQREHELADERFRQEIMDLKSELYTMQQKYEDATASSDHRGSFSGNDSMATTQSQSEDDDDYESYDENSLRHSTVHERDEISREVLIESLRQEIDALSSRVQDETDARATAEAKVQQLLVSLAQMEAMETELTDMTDELIEKSQEIRSRDEQIEQLRESLVKLQSEMANIRDGDIERTDEHEGMRNELESKIAEVNQLKDELDVVKSQCDDLAENERQLMIKLEEQSETVDELNEKIDLLTDKLEKSEQERSELEKRLQSDKGEISQNRKEVEELNSQNAELQHQLDEVSRKATELERASALSTASTTSTVSEKDHPETKRLMMEIQTMRTSLNSLSAENARLRNQEGISSSSVVPAKRVSADVLQVNFTPEQLARKYLAERTRNASLLSRLQTVCGNIQVFCRVRPIINEELEKSWGSKLAVNVVNQSDLAAMDIRPDRSFSNDNSANGNMEALANNSSWKVFTFDRILGPEETQNDVFREVEPIAQSVVDGFKACIFAYGQTGSGKTFTMEGTPSDPGLNYRIINHLFQSVQLRGAIYTPEPDSNEAEPDQDVDMEEVHAATESSMYHVQVGVLEIYNDSLRDLINTTNPKALEIRHDSTTGDICVPDLTMATVSSPQQTIDVLRNAQTNRVTGKTNVNNHSSRSHSIVIVQISKRRPESDDASDSTDFAGEEEGCGKLYLVDLAGSERVKKSNVSGEMLREAAHINKSLSALADVMEALDKKMAHVPYRNSKLTYLLQDVLNSSCKTVMIVNVGPTIENASETFRSLQLAERVRNIVVGRNQIVKNKKDILSAKKAFAELQSLKQQMQISKRKYMQSQQSVVALKRDQKNQSEKQSATLQSRLKSWETQNESLKTQNESLKRLVDDLSGQLKSERETKQKEVEQREAAQRQLRQQNAKSRVSSSQQEAQQKLLQEREEEIKKLRQLLTEARRRSTSSLIPRLPASSPPMKKTKSSRPTTESNQHEDDDAARPESSGQQPPVVSARLSKLRTVSRRSADSRLQTNGTTKESPGSSKRGTSLGSSRVGSARTASARTASKSKPGVWK